MEVPGRSGRDRYFEYDNRTFSTHSAPRLSRDESGIFTVTVEVIRIRKVVDPVAMAA